MTTLEILDRLQGDALKDGELRKKLLATRLEKDPLTVFCRLCRELGYELYEDVYKRQPLAWKEKCW